MIVELDVEERMGRRSDEKQVVSVLAGKLMSFAVAPRLTWYLTLTPLVYNLGFSISTSIYR